MTAVLPSHWFAEYGATRREFNDVPQYLWNQALNTPAEQFLTRCGKQIRSTLIREAFIAAGGVGETPRAIAESIELLHAGSLVIDDIEDDSAERRGQPTLHRQIGLPLALNTGNWMYFRALEKLSELETDDFIKYRILSQTVRIVRRCHEGQALDLSAAANLVAQQDVLPIVRTISRSKTGGLTALSAWLGAVTALGSGGTRKALNRFGMNVGVCLQMQNDLNELKQFVDGEQRFDDLRNARVTWPWAWAAKELSSCEFVALQDWLGKASRDSGELRLIACRLLDVFGKRGQKWIDLRLKRELTLLGEHVPSTSALHGALGMLQR